MKSPKLRECPHASTGPRLLGRGDQLTSWVISPFRQPLQRGRAFWGAEISRQHPDKRSQHQASTGPRLLGRGDLRCDAAGDEQTGRFNGAAPFGARRSGHVWRKRRRWSRFNGAAPFGARRSSGRRRRMNSIGLLQRGRAFWGAEMWRITNGYTCLTRRFNGAAPFGARR